MNYLRLAVSSLLLFFALFIFGDLLLATARKLLPLMPGVAEAMNEQASTDDEYADSVSLLNEFSRSPELSSRDIDITITGSELTASFVITLPIAHPAVPLIIEKGISKMSIAFIFGRPGLRSGEESNFLIYDTPYWTLNERTASFTIHCQARSSLSGETQMELASSIGIAPLIDKLTIRLTGMRLSRISQRPEEVAENRFVLDRTREIHAPLTFTVTPSQESKSSASPYETSHNALGSYREESNQHFFARLGIGREYSLLSSVIASFMSVLPILVFLRLAQKKKTASAASSIGAGNLFIEELRDTLICLLIFHFLLHGMTALGNFSFEWGGLDMLLARTNGIANRFHLATIYSLQGAPYRLGAALVSVFIPSVMLCRSFPERWQRFAKQKRWTFAISLMFLLPPTAYFLMSAALGKISDPAQGTILVVQATITAVLFGIFLNILHRQFTQKSAPPAVLIGTVLAFLFHNLLSGRRPEDLLKRDLSAYGTLALVIAGGLTLLTTCLLIARRLAKLAFPTWEPSRTTKLSVLGLSFLFVFPLGAAVDKAWPLASENDIYNLALRLDSLIQYIWLAGLVYLLYREGKNSQKIEASTRELGLLGLCGILFRPTSTWLFLPLTFLIGYSLVFRLVRRDNHWASLKRLLKPVFERRFELLDTIIEINAMQSTYQTFRKKMKEKVAVNELSIDEYRIQVERYRGELKTFEDGARIEGRPFRDVALEFGPYSSAWANGAHGAKWALIFALPWILISVRGILADPVSPWLNPFLKLGIDLLSLMMNWAALGFGFGYFYPYLRGKDGLRKGLGLFFLIAIPSIPLLAIRNSSIEAWQASLFWAMQIFIVCMLLGLVAFDYMILRQGRYDWEMLFEVHGFASLGISVTSIMAAISVAVTPLLSKGAMDLVTLALTYIIPQFPEVSLPKGN